MKGDHAQRFPARRQVLSLDVPLEDRNWSLPLCRYACGFLVPELGIHERVERLRVMNARELIHLRCADVVDVIAAIANGITHQYVSVCLV